MNKPIIYLLLSMFIFSSTLLSASEPKPTKRSNGVYTQNVGGKSGLFYLVDTVTTLCFVSPGGGAALTEINCQLLKNRAVWKEIITW
ncbi:hypothetical protein [Oceanicoccus sagamiensis]|uniref:Uncharacterized protein n=1 Tax=Oceanicoccus sagamiensis TaxID=716816 RepID=A0A1X9NFW2_9GAMM|nr:hypothetical protein [Oceanicoccus sagamiensis]ARN73837.1 hypothetical protein BST96_06745 [Oceanicoccus sagamiensis]